MAKQRNYSTEFKGQVVLEYLAGETLHGLAKRHDVSRNVIRLWVARYEADGELNDDTTAADLLQDYKARIAALERLAGKLALEVEFLKGALENARLPKNATSSVVAGPKVSPSARAVD
jgi:transposase-like protein